MLSLIAFSLIGKSVYGKYVKATESKEFLDQAVPYNINDIYNTEKVVYLSTPIHNQNCTPLLTGENVVPECISMENVINDTFDKYTVSSSLKFSQYKVSTVHVPITSETDITVIRPQHRLITSQILSTIHTKYKQLLSQNFVQKKEGDTSGTFSVNLSGKSVDGSITNYLGKTHMCYGVPVSSTNYLIVDYLSNNGTNTSFLHSDKMVIERGKSITDVRKESKDNTNYWFRAGLLVMGLAVCCITGEIGLYRRFYSDKY